VTVLEEIVARTRDRVSERRRARPIEGVLLEPGGPRRPFAEALVRASRPSVIAEFKRRSPSRGAIREDLTVEAVARSYEAGGAIALSVLTEEDYFGGSIADMKAARAATSLPVLRKDFVVDAYQVWEARAAGADAVLLIVAALSDRELRTLLHEARAARVEALVEVHGREEMDRALAAEARLLGVNNRDLKTLAVSLDTALSLAPYIPDEVVAVAESGLKTGDDLRRLRDAGYDAFLIGEHLMSAPDPGTALRALIEAAT